MTTELKDVFLITESDTSGEKYWARIGVAFVNKDASLNVVLDAIPISGRLHIRCRRVKKTSDKP